MDLLKLQKLLDDHQTGMSDFQDDYLVTARAGGTTYGQYKQSLREVYKRFRGLRELVYGENGRKWLDIQIKKLEKRLDEDELDELDREELELELHHKIMLQEESDRAIKDTYREFMRFYQQAEMLKEKIGELTPEKRRELETDMWVYRAKEMAAIDFLQSGRVSQRTVEFVSVLPKDVRPKVYELVFKQENHSKLIADYINREDVYELPFEDMSIPKIELNNVEKLITLEEPVQEEK